MLDKNDEIAALDIASMYGARKRARGPVLGRMQEIRRHFYGDIVVPLPELDDSERPSVPNLIAEGIKQTGMKTAEIMPRLEFPPLRPGIEKSRNLARDRSRANQSWWEMNWMQGKIRRRGLHLVAYGQTIVSLAPVAEDASDKRKIPHWRVRNPLGSFPAPMLDPESMEPTDCIFVDRRPLSWIRDNYPNEYQKLYRGTKTDADLFEILEYVDDCETVYMAVGADKIHNPYGPGYMGLGELSQVVLDRVPNRCGLCPVVVAGSIGLDAFYGQFDQTLGMFMDQAKLHALQMIAVRRNIFPDMYLIGNGVSTPRIIREAEGTEGITGIVANATGVEVIHPQPGSTTDEAIDRLERNLRVGGGIPAEWGGESPSNIRTARRGADVLSATVDSRVRENQEILARSLQKENERAVAIMKSYYGGRKTYYVMSTNGTGSGDDYTANSIFETDMNTVSYAMAGTDLNGLTIMLGQKVGAGLMSKQGAMEADPLCTDPIKERDQMYAEMLDQAMLTGAEQQAQQGLLSPHILAKVKVKLLEQHTSLEQAFLDVHKEEQEEQAKQAQEAQQMQQQANAGQQVDASPSQQPGIAGPAATIPPPMAGQENLSDLLNTLRRPTRTTPAENALAGAQ